MRGGRGTPSGRTGVTLVEVLIALVLVSLLMTVLYGIVSYFFSRESRSSLATMTERAFTQKDIRIGLKKLMLRIREGTEVLDPRPGYTSSELVFRDVLNQKVKIRLDADRKSVVSELFSSGAFVREEKPYEIVTAAGDRTLLARPIAIGNCSNVAFTVLSPSCVVVSLTLFSGHVENSLLTAIHLRNYRLAY